MNPVFYLSIDGGVLEIIFLDLLLDLLLCVYYKIINTLHLRESFKYPIRGSFCRTNQAASGFPMTSPPEPKAVGAVTVGHMQLALGPHTGKRDGKRDVGREQ